MQICSGVFLRKVAVDRQTNNDDYISLAEVITGEYWYTLFDRLGTSGTPNILAKPIV